MVTGTQNPITAEQLLQMPGDKRREIVQGELREMNPAGAEHGIAAMRVGALLAAYAQDHGGQAFAAETGFMLVSTPPLTIRAPDAAYVSAEHAERVGRVAGYWPGAPDLAVEGVSPGDGYNDIHENALLWVAHGAAVVLVVDPAGRHIARYGSPADIQVFAAPESIDCAPAMPGLAPTVEQLLPA